MKSLKYIFHEIAYWPVAAAALFHASFSLLRHFIDVEPLYPVDYRLGAAAIGLTVLFCILGRVRPKVEPGTFLSAWIIVAYLISCTVIVYTQHKTYYMRNQPYMYDTFVAVIFFYALGGIMSRRKKRLITGILLTALLFVWSAFIFYATVRMFQGRTFQTPGGYKVEMGSGIMTGLQFNSNPNTTAMIQLLFVMLAMIFFLGCRLMPLKVLYGIAFLINLAGMGMAHSRTCMAAGAAGAGAMICVHLHDAFRRNRKKVHTGVLIALGIVITAVCILFQSSIFGAWNTANKKRKAETDAAAENEYFIAQEQNTGICTDVPDPADQTGAVPAAEAENRIEAAQVTRSENRIGATPATESENRTGTALVTRSEKTSVLNRLHSLTDHPKPSVLPREADEQTAGKTDEQTEEESPLFKKVNKMLSDRLRIWRAACRALKESTKQTLIGVTPYGVFPAMERASNDKYRMYTHNQFLEVGVALGIPSMLLFIVFVLYTLWNVIRIFRRPSSGELTRLLGIFLLVLLAANMMEATLLFYFFTASYVYFFLCGWVNAEAAQPPVTASEK